MRQIFFVFLTVLIFTACARQDLQYLSPSAGGEEAALAPKTAHEGAAQDGEGHEAEKADDKPRPDSVISSVLSLPIVKKWSDFVEAKGNGDKIVAWGEYIKEVHGSKCWSIVVAEENSKGNDTVWKRFCMPQMGLEMWVESTFGTSDVDELNYISYEKWIDNCEPKYNSPGKC